MRIKSILAASAMVLFASTALAQVTGGRGAPKHDGLCAFALTQGHRVQTDCSIHLVTRGQMYCFENQRGLSHFATNLDENMKTADEVFGRM